MASTPLRERRVASLGNYKFFGSFIRDPLRSQPAAGHPTCNRLKSRGGVTATATLRHVVAERPEGPKADRALGLYWDALKAALADLVITDQEIEQLKRSEQELGLRKEQIRVLHARAFASVISQFIDDQWLDDLERRKLKRLHQCLSLLGWAPGE